MSLIPAQRRADELAAALDAGDVARADQLVPGVAALVSAASAVRPVRPEPQFSAALRQRLVAVAAVQAVAEPAPKRTFVEAIAAPRIQRRFAVMAGAAAGVVAFSGVGVASEQALPGDPFYGVKRAAESVELATAGGDLGKGTTHLEQAERRLAEIRELADDTVALSATSGDVVAGTYAWGGTTSERMAGAFDDMDDSTRAGARRLTAAFADGRTVAVDRLEAFAERQSAALEAVLPLLPRSVQDDAAASAALLDRLSATATSLEEEGSESPGAVPTRPVPTPSGTSAASPQPGTTSTAQPGSTPGSTPGGVPTGAPIPGVSTPTVPTSEPLPGLPTPGLPGLPTPTLPPIGVPGGLPSAVAGVGGALSGGLPTVVPSYSLPLP